MSVFIRIASWIATAAVTYIVVQAIIPLDPVRERTETFDRSFHVSVHWPFLTSSLLYTPQNLTPGKTYPLIVALHGGHRRSLGAYTAVSDEMQMRYPAFVLMPMAPGGGVWAKEGACSSQMAVAIQILMNVMKDHPVDPDRVYVTGGSNGGTGTFGLMACYPQFFAAEVPVNGYWPEEDAARLRYATLWAFHGEKDELIPVDYTQALIRAIQRRGGLARLTIMPGIGHNSVPAYTDTRLWDWLFQQRRRYEYPETTP